MPRKNNLTIVPSNTITLKENKVPRPKKLSIDDSLADYRARVKKIEAGTTSESVIIADSTYIRLTEFVEQEGCSMKEALRRAVKIGVEALFFLEEPVKTVQPFEREWRDVIKPYPPSPVSNGFPTPPQSLTQDGAVKALDEAWEEDARDYSVTAPPGM